jgi:hypothetical protein
MEDDDDVAELARLGSQVLKVLEAEAVVVTLHNGKVVEGSAANFSLRKKTRKGEVSWNGRFSVETDSGVLEMDCSNIASVTSR